jgi:hypothetical protein
MKGGIAMETVSTSYLLFWMVLLTLFLMGFFVIPRILLRRAISQVVRIFRDHHSLCSEIPKTVEELGLTPQSLMDRLIKPRDYKPYALQVLINAGVIRQGKEGKLCLLEEGLPELSKRM